MNELQTEITKQKNKLEKLIERWETGKVALHKDEVAETHKQIRILGEQFKLKCDHNECMIERRNDSWRDEYDSWHDNYRVAIRCKTCDQVLLDYGEVYHGYPLNRTNGNLLVAPVPLIDLAQHWFDLTGDRPDKNGKQLYNYGIRTETTTTRKFVEVPKKVFVRAA